MTLKDYVSAAIRTEADYTRYVSRLTRSNEAKSFLLLLNQIVHLGELTNRWKRAVIYGKDPEKGFRSLLIPGAYADSTQVIRLNEPDIVRLVHGLLGKMTEVGELVEALLSYVREGKLLDRVNIAEEMGDDAWYNALIFDVLGVDPEGILEANIAKLRVRYPEKFSEQEAIERDAEAERAALETNLTEVKSE